MQSSDRQKPTTASQFVASTAHHLLVCHQSLCLSSPRVVTIRVLQPQGRPTLMDGQPGELLTFAATRLIHCVTGCSITGMRACC